MLLHIFLWKKIKTIRNNKKICRNFFFQSNCCTLGFCFRFLFPSLAIYETFILTVWYHLKIYFSYIIILLLQKRIHSIVFQSINLVKTKWMNQKKCKCNFMRIWPRCISKARSQEKKKKTRRARRPQEGREVTLVIWPRGHLSSYTFGLIGMTMEASGLVKGYSQTTLTKIWSPTYPRLTLVKDFLYWHTVDISSTYHLPASSRQPSWSRQRSLWMPH